MQLEYMKEIMDKLYVRQNPLRNIEVFHSLDLTLSHLLFYFQVNA